MTTTPVATLTTFGIHKRHGGYALGGSVLRASGSMRCGRLTTPAGVFTVATTDRRRSGAVATAGGTRVVKLHRSGCVLPDGPALPDEMAAEWTLRGNTATLTRTDGARIVVRVAHRPRGPIQVELGGHWAQPELVVLTACFAVLSKRRRRLIMAIAAS